MKILFENVLENYSGIAATNQSLNFPVKNLVDFALHKRFQASESSSVITVDFDSDQCFNCFFYGYHNVDCMDLRFLDWAGNTVLFLEVSDLEDIGVQHFTQINGIRSVEITVYKNNVLIGSGVVNDEKFDIATYIPVNGAGIYPPYENALRDNNSRTYIPVVDLVNGSITINVPTGVAPASFKVDQAIISDGLEYTVYYRSAVLLESISSNEQGTPANEYYNVSNALNGSIDFIKDDLSDTFFKFTPFSSDNDKDILIYFTIVPKGYPQVQEWVGSDLVATLSGLEKSWSWQVGDYDRNGVSITTFFRLRNNANKNRVVCQRRNSDSNYTIKVYTDENGTISTTIALSLTPIKSLYTVSLLDNVLSVYENKNLILTETVAWVTNISRIECIAISNLGYTIPSLLVSTKESVGYSKDTIFESDSLSLFLGGIGAGCCYKMPDFLSVYERPNPDNSIGNESPGGQAQQNFVKPFRAYNFNFNTYADIAKAVYNEYIKAGVGKPLYIDIFEDAHEVEPPIYSKILAPIQPSQGKISNSYSLPIKECR